MGFTPVDRYYEALGLSLNHKITQLIINSAAPAAIFIIGLLISIWHAIKNRQFSSPFTFAAYFWIFYFLFLNPTLEIKPQDSLLERLYDFKQPAELPEIKTSPALKFGSEAVDKILTSVSALILPENPSEIISEKVRLNFLKEQITITEPSVLAHIHSFKEKCYKEAIAALSTTNTIEPSSQALQDAYSKIKFASMQKLGQPVYKLCLDEYSAIINEIKSRLSDDNYVQHYIQQLWDKNTNKSNLINKLSEETFNKLLLPEQYSHKTSALIPYSLQLPIYLYAVAIAIVLCLYPFLASFALLPGQWKKLLWFLQFYICLKVCPPVWFVIDFLLRISGMSESQIGLIIMLIMSALTPPVVFLLLRLGFARLSKA